MLWAILSPPLHATQTLTIASLLGADKPETQVWIEFGQRLEQRLPGEFRLRVITDAALGGEREVAEGIRLGSIHGSLSTLATMSAWVPSAGVFDMPFLFRDADHIQAVMQGPIGAEFQQKFREQGFRVLGYIHYGERHLLTKQPLTEPDEVRGQRIRVIESTLHTGLWRSLGAQPTPIPIPEVYNALQTGVVAMMDLTPSAYVGFRLHEVVPYLIETGHISALGIIYISETFFQSLNAEQQQAFLDTGAEMATYFNQLMAADQAASLAQAQAEGGQIVSVDRQQWQQAIEPFWAAFADRVGGMARLERIVASGDDAPPPEPAAD